MKCRSIPLLVSLFVAFGAAAAEPGLLAEARRARAEGIPQVAIQKLRGLLADKLLSQDVRDEATHELAAALLSTGETEEALWLIEPLAGTKGDRAAQLLKARLLVSNARWKEALPLFESLASSPPEADSARLGMAECLLALGQTPRALDVWESFIHEHPADAATSLRLASVLLETREWKRAGALLAKVQPRGQSEAMWLRYLQGRVLLAQGKMERALAVFEALLREPVGVPESVLAGAAIGSSQASAAVNGYDAADTVLEKFIWQYANSSYLETLFQRLDEVYAAQAHASDGELKKWAQQGEQRRAVLAMYYEARLLIRAQKPDHAMRTLDALVKDRPSSPLLLQAHLLRADSYLAKGRLGDAVDSLEAAQRCAQTDAQRAPIEMRMGLVHYQQGEALLAANAFHRAATTSPKLAQSALFDAGLSALRMKNYEQFSQDYRELGKLAADSSLLGELQLEQGLAQARTSDGRAVATLEQFLRHFPNHPRLNEARLALSELAFQQADLATANRYLKVVNTTAPTSETSDRAAYLAIFLADAQPQAEEKVIALGEKFLREFASSPLLPEVRMKLGQVYFHLGDHSNAETQFTLLAQENPASPYAETALFLAGQSAMRTINAGTVDRALALFQAVVDRNGGLKLYARQQQAIVQSKLGREKEAVDIYDAILTATPPPEPELRYAALCGKGDDLLVLGRKDAKQRDAAFAVFDQLATLPGVTPLWRNQALYKKGKALEQLARTPDALATYYDVLEKTATEGREFFWYYKAGFDAALLFEQQQQWKSAIGIYQKMAALDGPRTAEAKARISQLRLEKFIWE